MRDLAIGISSPPSAVTLRTHLGFVERAAARSTRDHSTSPVWNSGVAHSFLIGSPHRSTSPNGVREVMDTADPAPKDDREKLPYSPPKLTVHGDLRNDHRRQAKRQKRSRPAEDIQLGNAVARHGSRRRSCRHHFGRLPQSVSMSGIFGCWHLDGSPSQSIETFATASNASALPE